MPTPRTRDEIAALRAEVEKLVWFHHIDLGDGIETPGRDVATPEWKRWFMKFPADLHGWSVLDIGAWDGFFSFEAERRGASRVLATDSFVWESGAASGKAGFELARRALKSQVEDKTIDIYDLSPETVGTFDLVLFLGVLYHLRHPLLALEKVASVTRRMLILSTHVDMLSIPRPAMAYYGGTEIAGDPTNWCGPNYPWLEVMLKDVGFARVEKVSSTHEPDGDEATFRGRAMTVHAWK